MKRPVEVKTLVVAFSQLRMDQIESLSTTTWSARSSKGAPSVWGLLCTKLRQKDNEKNRKWLANIWRANMWSIVDEVRRSEQSMIGMKRVDSFQLFIFNSMMIPKPDSELFQTDVVDVSTSKSILEKPFLFCLLVVVKEEKVCSNTLEDIVDVVEIFSGCASMASVRV